MAKVYNGGVTLPTGFKLNDPQPIADYMVVEFIADLATLPNQFEGMVSYVLENQTLYVKRNATWETINDLPSPLISVTEGVNTGIRRKGFNPNNYGNIGRDAVDLSVQTDVSSTRGATGINSYAVGENTTASGQVSYAEGIGTIASGYASHAEGVNTRAIGEFASHAEGNGALSSGFASHAEGSGTHASGANSHAEGNGALSSGNSSHAEGDTTIASGVNSHAEGISNFSRSNGEHSGGRFGTDYTSLNNGTDRIVNYGNGQDENNRSNAFTVFRNGAARFFRATLASITNAASGFLIFDSGNGNRPTIHNGTEWKALAYVGEGGSTNLIISDPIPSAIVSTSGVPTIVKTYNIGTLNGRKALRFNFRLTRTTATATARITVSLKDTVTNTVNSIGFAQPGTTTRTNFPCKRELPLDQGAGIIRTFLGIAPNTDDGEFTVALDNVAVSFTNPLELTVTILDNSATPNAQIYHGLIELI